MAISSVKDRKHWRDRAAEIVSDGEPSGFQLCATLWTSQPPTLVPTADTRRDFVFCGWGLQSRQVRAVRLL